MSNFNYIFINYTLDHLILFAKTTIDIFED